MNAILKQLHHLRDRDLRRLSAAVDAELRRRIEVVCRESAANNPTDPGLLDDDMAGLATSVLSMRLSELRQSANPRRAA